MKEIEISNRKVGPDHKPLLIAEIGINHNGSLDEAKKIVDAAVFAGIEVIKHQTHVVDDEMSPEAHKVIPGNSDKSIYFVVDASETDRLKNSGYKFNKTGFEIGSGFE